MGDVSPYMAIRPLRFSVAISYFLNREHDCSFTQESVAMLCSVVSLNKTSDSMQTVTLQQTIDKHLPL